MVFSQKLYVKHDFFAHILCFLYLLKKKIYIDTIPLHLTEKKFSIDTITIVRINSHIIRSKTLVVRCTKITIRKHALKDVRTCRASQSDTHLAKGDFDRGVARYNFRAPGSA